MKNLLNFLQTKSLDLVIPLIVPSDIVPFIPKVEQPGARCERLMSNDSLLLSVLFWWFQMSSEKEKKNPTNVSLMDLWNLNCK